MHEWRTQTAKLSEEKGAGLWVSTSMPQDQGGTNSPRSRTIPYAATSVLSPQSVKPFFRHFKPPFQFEVLLSVETFVHFKSMLSFQTFTSFFRFKSSFVFAMSSGSNCSFVLGWEFVFGESRLRWGHLVFGRKVVWTSEKSSLKLHTLYFVRSSILERALVIFLSASICEHVCLRYTGIPTKKSDNTHVQI